jgi:putative DNA primase/helicase
MFVYGQKWKLNLKNGLLNVETMEMEEHTPKYFSTVQVPHEYDPTALCPTFGTFIETVSNNDTSTAQMIQEMFGYCLTDGNPKHKVFYLYGDTARNGKSTTAKIICGLIGWGNVSTLSLAQVGGDNSSVLTSLIGKQINFSDEISSKYIASSRLTALSAEAMIEINPKFKSAFLQKINAKFLITCNDLPAFNDYQGMKHRMIAIPFSYQIPQAERIERYEEILLEKEGAGILNWALKGMEILNKNKEFSFNEESIKDMHDNNMGSNPVYSFLEWYSADEEKVSVDDLYGSYSSKEGAGTGYRLFCHDKGLNPLNFFNFSKEVKRYANETKKIEQVRINNKRYYQGFNIQHDDFK